MARRAVVLMVMALSAACGGSDPGESMAAEATAAILITEVVAAPGTDGTAFVYMNIANEGTDLDQLIGASIPACAATELHEWATAGGSADMRAVEDGIFIPAQATVRLGPDALHIMCTGGAETWAEGDEVPISLDFRDAGIIDAVAVVGSPRG